jgi:uncharacterized protein (TIGR04255 family)
LVESPLPADLPSEIKSFLAGSLGDSGNASYKFSNEDSTWHIDLSSSTLSIATSNYERYEFFKEKVELAIAALTSVYKPSFFNRVGLRYKDVVDKEEIGKDLAWKELLQPHLVGELNDPNIGNQIRVLKKHLVIEIENGAIRLLHGLVKVEGKENPCYLIDADFIKTNKTEVTDGIEIIDGFKILAGRLFRWAITEKLHGALGPNPA